MSPTGDPEQDSESWSWRGRGLGEGGAQGQRETASSHVDMTCDARQGSSPLLGRTSQRGRACLGPAS